MASKKLFFVYEVHFINYPALLVLSLFGQVAYIKRPRKLKLSSKRFCRINVNNLLKNGQSEFNSINARAYSNFKRQIESAPSKYAATGRIDGKSVNFTQQHITDIGKKYEIFCQYLYFASALEKRNPQNVYVKLYPVRVLDLHSNLAGKINLLQKLLVQFFNFTDSLWSKCFLVYEIYNFLKPNYKPYLLSHMKNLRLCTLWSGINPQEVNLNENDNLARFWFLDSKRLTNSGKILFVLPVTVAQAKQINRVFAEQFFVLSSKEMSAVMPRFKRIYLLLLLVFEACRHIVHRVLGINTLAAASASYLIRSVAEYELCKQLRLGTFLTSNSAHSIYNAKFALCSILGARTVLWQYSGVGLIPYDNTQTGSNQKMIGRFAQYCFACSDVFVWNELDIKILRERLLKNVGPAPNFTAIGPMMPGNLSNIPSSEMEKQKKRALFFDEQRTSNHGFEFWITIFDMPTHSEELVTTGELPITRITEEEQDLFFAGLLKLFEEYPEIVFVMKPKRRLLASKFILSKNHQLFLRLAQSVRAKHRFIIVPHNIDPYLPIGISDAAISMPFSSALQAAVCFGLPAAYYDASGQYRHVYPENDYLSTHSYYELQSVVSKWISSHPNTQNNQMPDFQKTFAEEIGLR